MIWLIFALLTACVVLAVTRPLGRASTAAAGYVSEIEAYKLHSRNSTAKKKEEPLVKRKRTRRETKFHAAFSKQTGKATEGFRLLASLRVSV